MKRVLIAAFAVVSILCLSNSASAQHHRRGCRPVSGFLYSTPYYSYRSVGPGTHISRYAVPGHGVPGRVPGTTFQSYRYRVPTVHPYGFHSTNPYLHRGAYPYSLYRYGYGLTGPSLSIRF